MGKKNIIFVFMFLILSSVYIKEICALESFFFGVGPEINAHTRHGLAAGGILYGGLDLNPKMSAGIKLGFFYDFDTVKSLEPLAFFRYYLPLKLKFDGIFVQADAGSVFYFEDSKNYPAFSGGLTAGWRFYLKNNWFLEPAFRFGYPYMWGLGIMAGLKAKYFFFL